MNIKRKVHGVFTATEFYPKDTICKSFKVFLQEMPRDKNNFAEISHTNC